MSEFEFRTSPKQHTAVVAVTTTPDRIGESMGEAFGAVFAAVGKAGVTPLGPPMCVYTAFSEESVTFEAGVPVAAPFPGDGDVVAGEIGGAEEAVGIHLGPYDKLSDTYGAMQAWIESQGRVPGAVMWESYLSDLDSTPAAELRTEIHWPAEKE